MKQGTLPKMLVTIALTGWLAGTGWAQVDSGSDGSDGAFTPTATNTVINMADHPTGIYQFTAVNIPAYVTVTFLPNPNNTPVVWLVQSNVIINGTVDVSESGQNAQLTSERLGLTNTDEDGDNQTGVRNHEKDRPTSAGPSR